MEGYLPSGWCRCLFAGPENLQSLWATEPIGEVESPTSDLLRLSVLDRDNPTVHT